MLDILRIFLEETKNLNWCHWKSNIRLEQSLSGKTDLDILVHPEHIDIFQLKLKKCKFVEFKTPGFGIFGVFADAVLLLINNYTQNNLKKKVDLKNIFYIL